VNVLARPLRVLLVEDSKVLTERVAETLRQTPDVELIGAVDTEDAARDAVARNNIDLMILDLHLKQGNGFGVLRGMVGLTDKPEVVVLTNYDLPEYQAAAMALGASHFMDKVRDFDKLAEVLQQLVGKSRSKA
jgi:DNA-binding NarL/FixJ family response regulator